MKKKPIWVDEELHARIKATAALSLVSMQEWASEVLTAALPDRARVLVDEREPYTVKEATE